jgi:hypothetical protein
MKKLQEDQWTKSMNHTVESEPSAPPAADKQVVCDEPAKPALQPVRKRGCTLVLQPEAICRKTDLLSVVWKSRNSSRGLYRCPRRSAHDRRPANAMRFLMKTLRQRPSPALIPAFREDSVAPVECSSSAVLGRLATTVRAISESAAVALLQKRAGFRITLISRKGIELRSFTKAQFHPGS